MTAMNDILVDAPGGNGRVAPTTNPTVLLACVDAEHEWMGRKCITHLRQSSGDASASRVVAWNLERLGSPSCKMLATLDAIEARQIVVAASGHQALSEDARTWIQHWPSRRRGNARALVAVLSGTNPGDAATWPDHDLLGQTAARCGLKYLVYSGGLPANGNVEFSLSATHRRKPNKPSRPVPAG